MINNLKLWLAAGLGSGFLPFFPGTWGSLVVLLPIYFILGTKTPLFFLLLFIAACIAINFLVAGEAERSWGNDPSKMVMDEWAGQSVVFLGLAIRETAMPDYLLIAAAFVLFRFFDVLKPFGIKKIQKLNGGFGILADDLLAGGYALIILEIIILL